MELLILVLVVAVPGCVAIAVAYFAGIWLRSNMTFLPAPIRVSLAGFAPSIAIVGFFWTLHEIDYALYQAEHGDAGYMSPLVALLYGAPVFLVIAIGSFFFAARTFYKAQ